MTMKLGDGMALIAMMIWLMVAVGPMWLGPVIFGAAFLLNFLQAWVRKEI